MRARAHPTTRGGQPVLRTTVFGLALLAAAALVGFGAVFLSYVGDIATLPSPRGAAASAAEPAKPVVRIGVVSRFAPTMIYHGYQPIMDYLTASGPYTFELKVGASYHQTVSDLVAGKVAAAFLGTFIYVAAHDRYGVVPILKPLNDRMQPTFQAVLVVRDDSPIRSIADLKGKAVALPSPESFSGNWLTTLALGGRGLTPQDLRAIRYFEHHHTVIFQVLRGAFDAGVVKDRVAEEYIGHGIREVERSEPMPGSPIVVAPLADPKVVAFLSANLLAVDPRKPEHAEMLRGWDQEFRHGFVPAHDDDYRQFRHLSTAATRKP
jgi:phosphonate transport system substrate-binding protein